MTEITSDPPRAGLLRFVPPHRWQIVGLTILMQAACMGFIHSSFTFYVQPWMEEFGAERTTVLGIISLHLVAIAAVSVFAGRWLDTIGPRYLVLAGLACLALGAAIISLAPNLLTILLTYVIVLPFAATLTGTLGAVTIVARAFTTNRGLAIGIATLGVSAGGVIFPFLVANMLAGADWRSVILVLGLAAPAIVAPFAWFVLPGSIAKKTVAAGATAPPPSSWLDFVKRWEFWVLIVGFQSMFVVGTGLAHNLRPFAGELGISIKNTATILASMAICGVVGKLFVGFLADRIDNRYIYVGAAVSVAGGAFLLLQADGFVTALIACCTLGLAQGGVLPLRGNIYATTFSAEALGRALGLAAPFTTITASGPIIAARIRDASGSYDVVFIVIMCVMAVAAPVMLLLPRRKPIA